MAIIHSTTVTLPFTLTGTLTLMVFPPSRLGLFSFSIISVPRPESLLLSTSESMLTPPHDTILEFDDTCDTWERVVETDLHLIFHRTIHVYVAPCKEIQDSLELCRFHAVNWFRILGTGFQSLVGFWIPWVVFRIPRSRILDSKSENFPDSGMRIPLHGPTHALLIKREVTMAEYRPYLRFYGPRSIKTPKRI